MKPSQAELWSSCETSGLCLWYLLPDTQTCWGQPPPAAGAPHFSVEKRTKGYGRVETDATLWHKDRWWVKAVWIPGRTALLYCCHCGQWQRSRVEVEAGATTTKKKTGTIRNRGLSPLRMWSQYPVGLSGRVSPCTCCRDGVPGWVLEVRQDTSWEASVSVMRSTTGIDLLTEGWVGGASLAPFLPGEDVAEGSWF